VNQPDRVQLQFANDRDAERHRRFTAGVVLSRLRAAKPESGVLKGKLANGTVTVAIPNPRTQLKPFAPPPNNNCDLEFHASNSKMAESNTLKTAVDFR
jgi:hypothetical protein